MHNDLHDLYVLVNSFLGRYHSKQYSLENIQLIYQKENFNDIGCPIIKLEISTGLKEFSKKAIEHLEVYLEGYYKERFILQVEFTK